MIVAVYADGGMLEGNVSLEGGTWAYCHVNEQGERVRCAGGILRPLERYVFYRHDGHQETRYHPITNGESELHALTQGLLALPQGWSGNACTDSAQALSWAFGDKSHRHISEELYHRARYAVARLGNVRGVLLNGHPTDEELLAGRGERGGLVSVHNRWTDGECRRQAAIWRARKQEHEHDIAGD